MKTIKTDIAVMGSGLAGLAAAYWAAKKGDVKVTLFEKRAFQGGAVSNCPMMFLSVPADPKCQAQALKVHNQFVGSNADIGVAKTWFQYSSMLPDMLEKEIGVRWLDVLHFPPESYGHMRGYTIGFPNGMHVGDYYLLQGQGLGHGASVICLKMRRKLEEMGVEIHFNTALKHFEMQDGRIVGATGETRDGEQVKVECGAVVVAAGGISGNPEMLKEEMGMIAAHGNNCTDGDNIQFIHFSHSGDVSCSGQDGDGHKAVWEVGGDKTKMAPSGDRDVPNPGISGYTKWVFTNNNQIRTVQGMPYFTCNELGERFCNEEDANDHMSMNCHIAHQPGKHIYLIFDENTAKHLAENGPEKDFCYFIFSKDKIVDLEGQIKALQAAGNKHVFLADSIADLCKQTGIDEKGLRKSIEAYNGYCEKGCDEAFGTNPQYLRPIREESGKLYCLEQFRGGYSVQGGIRINRRCEVLNKERYAIPGLYAAGDNVSASVFGEDPGIGCGTMSQAMSLGMAAADNCYDYVKGLKA